MPGLASRTLPWLDRPLHFRSDLVALSDNRRFVIWLMCHIIKNGVWFIKWTFTYLRNQMKVHLYSSDCTVEQWRVGSQHSFICLSSISYFSSFFSVSSFILSSPSPPPPSPPFPPSDPVLPVFVLCHSIKWIPNIYELIQVENDEVSQFTHSSMYLGFGFQSRRWW